MNGYLLDTHAALWWWTDVPRLSGKARELLERTRDPVVVSTVTALEIAIKWRLGKLPNLGDPRDNYLALMARNGFVELSVTAGHALLAGTLEGLHRDPFDRVIAAQALEGDLTVVTRDEEIAGFGCKVLW